MYTEKELLEIAKEVISKNNHLNAKLGGSLMLYNMGLNKHRDAADIDIICDDLCDDTKSERFPWTPQGFELYDIDGILSCVSAMRFINSNGLRIKFMWGEDIEKIINNIPCAELSQMVLYKLMYSKHDITSESRNKHLDDLIFLFVNNFNLKI